MPLSCAAHNAGRAADRSSRTGTLQLAYSVTRVARPQRCIARIAGFGALSKRRRAQNTRRIPPASSGIAALAFAPPRVLSLHDNLRRLRASKNPIAILLKRLRFSLSRGVLSGPRFQKSSKTRPQASQTPQEDVGRAHSPAGTRFSNEFAEHGSYLERLWNGR